MSCTIRRPNQTPQTSASAMRKKRKMATPAPEDHTNSKLKRWPTPGRLASTCESFVGSSKKRAMSKTSTATATRILATGCRHRTCGSLIHDFFGTPPCIFAAMAAMPERAEPVFVTPMPSGSVGNSPEGLGLSSSASGALAAAPPPAASAAEAVSARSSGAPGSSRSGLRPVALAPSGADSARSPCDRASLPPLLPPASAATGPHGAGAPAGDDIR
mmetsp:Transcript_46793/g.134793  ORF Transcript_46793/g.134793 Transcript_46793/m.134793 type:complete len:216 (-) Transcript_46793:33-680(-)